MEDAIGFIEEATGRFVSVGVGASDRSARCSSGVAPNPAAASAAFTLRAPARGGGGDGYLLVVGGDAGFVGLAAPAGAAGAAPMALARVDSEREAELFLLAAAAGGASPAAPGSVAAGGSLVSLVCVSRQWRAVAVARDARGALVLGAPSDEGGTRRQNSALASPSSASAAARAAAASAPLTPAEK